MTESKSLFTSKTFWVNTAGAALVPALQQIGVELTAEEVGAVFAGLNILLRVITKTAVHFRKRP